MRTKLLLVQFVVLMLMLFNNADAQKIYKYSIPDKPWAEWLGNHRAIIEVPVTASAVCLNYDWRRHDKYADKHRFFIINGETNDTVLNILRLNVNADRCEIVFGPVSAGKYYFYYLPYKVQLYGGNYDSDYLPIENPPEKSWVAENNLSGKSHSGLVEAKCVEVQARTDFDSFYPMEVIASHEEKNTLIAANGGAFLLFAEDRKYPIRMLDNIPQKWVSMPTADKFSGEASRNEYYVFQVGLWAIQDIKDIKVEFTPLKGTGFTLPVSAMTCFNTGGIDPSGTLFTKIVNVAKGKVQPLWIGLDLPKEVPAGKYTGNVVIRTQNAGQKEVNVEIYVNNELLEDRGDSETWRHSRLRWLNSTAGIDDKTIAPYKPIGLKGKDKISLSFKEIKFTKDGLPASIKVFGEEVLSAPVQFNVAVAGSNLKFSTPKSKMVKQATGIVIKEFEQTNKSILLKTRSEVESDGYLRYIFSLEAQEDVEISDIKIEIPYKKSVANLLMGMDTRGIEAPDTYDAKWQLPYDAFWLGNTKTGLHCELRGASYNGPILGFYKPAPPNSWFNEGNGGFKIRTNGNQRNVIAYSGNRILKKGEKLEYECALIITPVKKIDTREQFVNRYYHNTGNPEPTSNELELGVKIVNVHHANQYNPNINYPFVANEELKALVDRCHSKGLKVKVYYSTRLLSNWAEEIWALRSFGEELYGQEDNFGNHPWLKEHLVDSYNCGWYQHLDSLKSDLALAASAEKGQIRWYNYYVEGLRWLVDNIGIDGVYLDDASFDRDVVKRMRKVVSDIKPGMVIDLHSYMGIGGYTMAPAVQYTGFFPYIDKLWFGENYFYNEMSAPNWLAEVSGIPFGLMGDMLHKGGNPWRGMLYGMTARLGHEGNPTEILKLWNSFGINDSKMVGYWEDQPLVTASNKDVLATAYVKDKKVLISVASWATETISVTLNLDYERLGLDPKKVKITAPELKNIQKARSFNPGEPLSIDPTKGWLLVVE